MSNHIIVLFACFISSALSFVDYHRQYLWDTYPATILGPNTLIKINYCALEEYQQTPINFNPLLIQLCPQTNARLEWHFGTALETYTVENNGEGLKFTINEKLGSVDAVLYNNFVTAVTPPFHLNYCLDSFHIHYGINSDKGTEHSNDGVFSPMEMHFVHFGCEYETLGKALEAPAFGDPNKLAVVGIIFEISAVDNPFWTEVLKFIDILRDYPNSVEIPAHLLNIEDITPTDVDGIKGNRGPYYVYDGGLTTPPCTPIVQWHVLQTPQFISEAQMEQLRMLQNDFDPPFQQAPTYRNLQPQLSTTTVSECPGEVTIH